MINTVRKYGYSAAILIFLSGFYFSPSTKALNNTFYLLILAPFFIAIIQDRTLLFKVFKNHCLLLLLILIMLLSSVINGISVTDLGHQLSRIIYISGFIGALSLAALKDSDLSNKIISTIIVISPIAACYSIYCWFSDGHSYLSRMTGWGVMDNPILLASTYAFAAITGLTTFLKGSKTKDYLLFLSFTPSILILLLTQSRGPLLAFSITIIAAITFIYRNKRSALIFSLGLIIICFASLQQTRIFSSDSNYRLEIWSVTLEKARQSPLLGLGLQESKKVSMNSNKHEKHLVFNHPHSIYLTTALHGGLFSLSVLLVMYARSLIWNWQDESSHIWRLLLLFGLIYSIFEGGRIFTSTKEIWLIIWLPFAMLLTPNLPVPTKKTDSTT